MGLMDWMRGRTPSDAGTVQPNEHPRFGTMATWSELDAINAVEGDASTRFTSGAVEALLGSFGTAPGEIYKRQPAVRICVDFLSRNIAQLGIHVFRRVTDETPERVRDHPLADLLARPNPRMTRFDLMLGTVADLAVYDNAFWLKQRKGNQRQMFLLPPVFVRVEGGNILTGPTKYVYDTGNNDPKEFSPEEIVHFHGFNPSDTRIGMSPIEALRDVLAEEAASSAHRRGFWRNAARPEGWLERGSNAPKLSDEAAARMRADIQNVYSGAANAGKIGLLEEDTHFNPAGFSPKDSEFIAGREFALDLVATMYHIPLSVLSRKQTSTFASAKEFRKALYVDTLGPWNAMIEGALGLQLVPDFGDPDLFVQMNIREKIEGDHEQQAESLRAATIVPYLSPNDAREKIGMSRVEDDRYDVPARPVNYVYGDEEPPPEPTTSSLAAFPDQESAPANGNGKSNGNGNGNGKAAASIKRVLRDESGRIAGIQEDPDPVNVTIHNHIESPRPLFDEQDVVDLVSREDA